MITRPEKYNFKVSINQFGQKQLWNYEDSSESELIDIFETCILKLKEENRTDYTMIELGSNQCFYSLLFKHILGKLNTKNILVEPLDEYMQRSIDQMKLNDCDGIFLNKSVGNSWAGSKKFPEEKEITLIEICDQHNITNLDVLHCDIDGSENILIDDSYDFFKQQRVRYFFLCTHSSQIHQHCRDKMLNAGYKLIKNNPEKKVGGDSLLVFEK